MADFLTVAINLCCALFAGAAVYAVGMVYLAAREVAREWRRRRHA